MTSKLTASAEPPPSRIVAAIRSALFKAPMRVHYHVQAGERELAANCGADIARTPGHQRTLHGAAPLVSNTVTRPSARRTSCAVTLNLYTEGLVVVARLRGLDDERSLDVVDAAKR
jgi:hypothetical protein